MKPRFAQIADAWGVEVVCFVVGFSLAAYEAEAVKGIVWIFFFPLVFKLVMRLLRD